MQTKSTDDTERAAPILIWLGVVLACGFGAGWFFDAMVALF